MPPAISDDESDDLDIPDMIPAKGKAKAKAIDPEPMEADDDDEEEEEEEEGDEDAYQVEKILKHDYAVDGTILYQIKWLGYDDKADLTWEPVDNLETAPDVLAAYHATVGGPPEPKPSKGSSKKPSTKAKGKRTASEALDALDSPLPTSTSTSSQKRGRKSNGLTSTSQQPPAEQKRTLPPGTWDDHVLAVSSIVEEETPMRVGGGKAGPQKKELIGLLEWRDQGPKTQHKMKVLRQKVPQRLLDYYEQHL
ncbi:hypothetical protein LTR78_001861 [Recurvomyces mirabilis]|uniref:Chromo domain-containing protein n=1 Tax=Recurvomyces mirabilis TaxID=574656 RepID=A0AAE0WVD9_9PEZI|nr:hypothetical protein LTR78_001861 [Recurvomyces mirabilis]KAK5156699.1 hypothetical protein LTS14_004911 [Recurvomyces mirabilis]